MSNHLTIRTRNSVYELRDNSMRLVSSVNQPFRDFKPLGEWKVIDEMIEPQLGEGFALRLMGSMHWVCTSTVREIERSE